MNISIRPLRPTLQAIKPKFKGDDEKTSAQLVEEKLGPLLDKAVDTLEEKLTGYSQHYGESYKANVLAADSIIRNLLEASRINGSKY
jgi:hypothetical protein